jgi:cbb3-type cytochrome oxidase subunit 1
VDRLNNHVDINQVHSKLFNLGLLMNVGMPVVIVFVGGLLKAQGIGGEMGERELNVFFWALAAVAVSEIPVIYIIRRSFLSGSKAFMKSRSKMTIEQSLFQWGMITFSLALAPSIYGLVYYLLGGALERFVLFAALTLLCFLVFKPKLEEIDSFVQRRKESLENSQNC